MFLRNVTNLVMDDIVSSHLAEWRRWVANYALGRMRHHSGFNDEPAKS